MGETVSQAVRAKRLYHKLVPNVLYYEGTVHWLIYVLYTFVVFKVELKY